MKDNRILKSKISNYLALAGGITTAATGANAQVVYTDINPDYLLSGNMSTYLLDLNNDAIPDFSLTNVDTLMFSSVTSGSSGSYSYNMNIKAGFIDKAGSFNSWMVGSNTYPAPIAQGVNIGSSASFNSYGTSFGIGAPFAAILEYSYMINGVPVYNNVYTSYGNFTPDQEGILGLKFKINNDIHYGWVRVEYTLDGRLSIKDYAYEATPNTAVLAGETGSGLVSIKENENAVQINNFNNNLQVELLSELTNAHLKMTNVSGQEVISKVINSAKEIISLNEYSSGIYLATVTSDEGVTTKRIYVR